MIIGSIYNDREDAIGLQSKPTYLTAYRSTTSTTRCLQIIMVIKKCDVKKQDRFIEATIF